MVASLNQSALAFGGAKPSAPPPVHQNGLSEEEDFPALQEFLTVRMCGQFNKYYLCLLKMIQIYHTLNQLKGKHKE